MATHALRNPWAPRLATLALWALAGAGALYWALALSPRAEGPAPVAAPQAPAVDPQAVARLLGAGAEASAGDAAPAPQAPARFRLLGVLSGTASGGGAALIAVDGKPAKPFRLGAEVEPGLVVQSLSRREVHLGPPGGAPAAMTLQVPLKP